MRKVNYLNVNKLIKSIKISGVTDLIVSKVDILEKLSIYKYYYNEKLLCFNNLQDMINGIEEVLNKECSEYLKEIIYSNNPEKI